MRSRVVGSMIAATILIGGYAVVNGGGGGAGLAAMFVAASGSDSCTRSSTPLDFASASGHICATPSKACSIAQSGDTVILEDGTYVSHMDGCATGHQNYAQNVIFKPEPGHECAMSYPNVPDPPSPFESGSACDVHITGDSGDGQLGLSLGGNVGKTCGVTGHPLPSSLAASAMSGWDTHLTFQGIDVGDMTAICSAHVSLINGAGNHWFLTEGVYDWDINGGTYCCRTDAAQPTQGDSIESSGNWPPLEKLTIENAVVSDFMTFGAGHGDGFFTDPSYDVHIIKNVLARNDCIPIYRNYATTAAATAIGAHGYWVIGNVVHLETVHNGGGTCAQSISLGDATGGNTLVDSIVAFNSIQGPIDYNDTSGATNVRIVGNIAWSVNATNDSPGCASGISASYNVLYDVISVNCGDSSNATNAPQQFVSYDTTPNSQTSSTSFHAPLGDYSLAAGVSAIGKVPTSWCSTDSATQAVCDALTTDINGSARPNSGHSTFLSAGAYENR